MEATVVFPVFLCLMVAIVNLVNITSVYLSVDHAVGETVKVIASRAYPLQYLSRAGGRAAPDAGFAGVVSRVDLLNQHLLSQSGQGQTAESQFYGQLIETVNEEVSQAFLDNAAKSFARAKINQLYPLGNINDLDLKITGIKMYNPLGNNPVEVERLSIEPEDIMLSVEYKIRLIIPFFSPREIMLTNSAVERAWADG